jgi:hypothetical protein
MARVAFSNKIVDITDFANHHSDLEDSLRSYFSPNALAFNVRFFGDTIADVNAKLKQRLAEVDIGSALTVLSALEAKFRIDYLQRCYRREKDVLSRAFRELHKKKQTRVRLETEILDAWKRHTDVEASVIADLRAAFAFRHWLAHGRYWEPKLGRKYDFPTVYALSVNVLTSFPLLGLDPV